MTAASGGTGTTTTPAAIAPGDKETVRVVTGATRRLCTSGRGHMITE